MEHVIKTQANVNVTRYGMFYRLALFVGAPRIVPTAPAWTVCASATWDFRVPLAKTSPVKMAARAMARAVTTRNGATARRGLRERIARLRCVRLVVRGTAHVWMEIVCVTLGGMDMIVLLRIAPTAARGMGPARWMEGVHAKQASPATAVKIKIARLLTALVAELVRMLLAFVIAAMADLAAKMSW